VGVLFHAANRPRAVWGLLAARAAGATPLLVPLGAQPEDLATLLATVDARAAFVSDEEQLDLLDEALTLARRTTTIVYDEPRGIAGRQDPRLAALDGLLAGPARPARESGLWEAARWSEGAWEIAAVTPVGEGPDASDEVVLAEPLAEPASLSVVLEPWLRARSTLCLAENPDSADADLAEVAPRRLAGSSAFFTGLWQRALARAGSPGGWRRRLIDAALRARGPGRVLARALVLRPLARVLGLARVRSALAVGEPLPAGARSFFAALGIEVDHISGAQPRLRSLRPAPWAGDHQPTRSAL